MSSFIFEFKKKKNYKNIFGTINNSKEKKPIKLIIDSDNKYNSSHNKLYETKKFPKIFQIEKTKKLVDDSMNLKLKTIEKKDEPQNIRYYLNKKINKKMSRNFLKEINNDDNDFFSLKYISTVKSNKFLNNNYNKCSPNRFSKDRKIIENSPLSPLVSHSIDIIKNNPYNKKLFIKNVNKRENEIKKLLYKKTQETGDNFFIHKNFNISPIHFNNKNDEKLKGNLSSKKVSHENYQNDSESINSYKCKKDIINDIYIDNNKKSKTKNMIADSYKQLNRRRKNNLYIQIDLEQNKEIEKKDTIKLIKNYKMNNNFNRDKIDHIKKAIFNNNIRLKLNSNYFDKNDNEHIEQEDISKNEKIYYKDKELIKNENIEYISDDELKEYYIKKCNVIIEYAYKEDRNFLHKINMEDKGKSILNFNNDPYKLLFCLFDGHGGDEVSTYLQKNFALIMKKYINNKDEEIDYDNLFQEIDEEFKNCKYYQRGSTATIIYITEDIINHKKKLYCINIGDTRCILTHTSGSRKLSYDDLVSDENEFNRIINDGGYIKNGRVCGQLMISRAFGDRESKSYGVICTPHVTKIDINEKCKYVIMASDGIWDVLDDLDVYKLSLSAENSKNLCDDIIQGALDKDSTDNLSCFVIKLND